MPHDINSGLIAFASWLSQTPLNKVIAEILWIVPTVQIIHILAVAATVAAVAMISLNAVGALDRTGAPEAVQARYLPVLWLTLPILALTGLVLIIGEPTRAIFRTVFWAKLALIALATGLTVSLRWERPPLPSPLPPVAAALVGRKARAGLAILSWLCVIVAGRWIGYAIGWPGSP